MVIRGDIGPISGRYRLDPAVVGAGRRRLRRDQANIGPRLGRYRHELSQNGFPPNEPKSPTKTHALKTLVCIRVVRQTPGLPPQPRGSAAPRDRGRVLGSGSPSGKQIFTLCCAIVLPGRKAAFKIWPRSPTSVPEAILRFDVPRPIESGRCRCVCSRRGPV